MDRPRHHRHRWPKVLPSFNWQSEMDSRLAAPMAQWMPIVVRRPTRVTPAPSMRGYNRN
jgi:hypothetical protein